MKQSKTLLPVIAILFFLSGIPALIYQLLWQRLLFSYYGVNIQSVTVIVTLFMLGLGLGALFGGKLSKLSASRLLFYYAGFELIIAVFGVTSMTLIHTVGTLTNQLPLWQAAGVISLLIFIPTLLMGATLPMLATLAIRRTGQTGNSVSWMYFANTLGAGAACFIAAYWLFARFGISGSLIVAASLNLLVAISVALLRKSNDESKAKPDQDKKRLICMTKQQAFILAGVVGFISLSYEILWTRSYFFAASCRAAGFAELLGAYLVGLALGSLYSQCLMPKQDTRVIPRALIWLMLGGSVVSFLVMPILSVWVMQPHYLGSLEVVVIASSLLGAIFPFICELCVNETGEAGKQVAGVYLANILGAVTGSMLTGFVLLNVLNSSSINLILLIMGLGTAAVLAMLRGARLINAAPIVLMMGVACLLNPLLMQHYYSKLLFKSQYHGQALRSVIENNVGVIAVTQDERVYGNGVYDGHFNIYPNHDTNMIFRAYAIPLFSPAPKKVLMVGLSSGSWAQVIANNPNVQSFRIIEIDPGYLKLIPKHKGEASVLHNPKVHITIDDGRRWLERHPNKKYDLIVMNTTFYWRAYASLLLSKDFFHLIKQHLTSDGVFYFNTTSSARVQRTAAYSFKHTKRLANFIIASNAPLKINQARLMATLRHYRIDGKLMYQNGSKIWRLMNTLSTRLESREHLLKRTKGSRLITDNNMGQEW